MRWWIALRTRISLLLQRARAESRMDEEFRFHLDMETEANLRKGFPPAEARRRAYVSFGGMERHKEVMREGRGARAWERAWRDARYAVRALTRAPVFSVTAVVTLALGSGSLTAIFALVNGILLSPLPYPDADRLVAVAHSAPGLGLARTGLSSGTFFHYRERATSLEGLALYTEAIVNLSGGDAAAERVELAMVSPEFFGVLQVSPILGRTFTAEEIAANDGSNLTGILPVLLSHDLWQSRYGGDPGILDRTVDINTRARQVVGVLPPRFAFPRASTQVWMLTGTPERTANLARGLDYEAVARLRPGVTAQEAQAELALVLPSIAGAYPDATPARLAELRLRPIVVPLKNEVVGNIRSPLWILMGSMSLLLLAACANVTNLCLARSHVRLREMSVRSALGAGRMDLMRIFAGESLLLAVAGAALGLLLAAAAISVLLHFAPGELPRLDDVRLDGRVLGFALGTALLVSGILAAGSMLRHTQTDQLAPALKSAGRGGTAGPESGRMRGALVAAQVALAITLLVGCALMGQTFLHLVRVDPGFDPEDVLAVDMGLPGSLARSHREIFETLLERVRALPGVTDAAAVSQLPLTESVWTQPFAHPLRVEGMTSDAAPVDLRFFLPGYFQTLGIPLLEGVSFARGEIARVPHPVVVSDALAARLFPGESAVGKRIRRLEESGEEITYGVEARPQPDYVVAGVVADVRGASLREGPWEVVYVPVLDPPVDPGFYPTEMSLVIRARDPMELAPAVREIMREINPVLGVARIRTLEGIVSASLARERLLALLLAVAGGGSLLLGAVGIYGVVGYMARQRTQEIGLRMVLGARAGEIVRLVLQDSIAMVAAGTALGLVIAIVGTRALQSVLFVVRPGDPLTLLLIATLVLGVALAAILIPARRATKVDPMGALRSE